MKKIILLLVLSVLFTQIAMAQNTFGVKAGFNLSNQYLHYPSSSLFPYQSHHNHNLAGYQLGAFYKIKLSKKWMIASEVNFSAVGSKTTYFTRDSHDSAFIIKNLRDRVGYAELPFSLQYTVNRFYVGLGPSVAFRLFSKISLAGVKAYYNTMDAAANVLAGYKVAKKWDINVRYSYGLLNTLYVEKTFGDNLNSPTKKNRFANVSFLYSLF